MADLTNWLAQDWQDVEDKRVYFLNRIAKYGNDNDDVDAMAIRVMNHFCDVLLPIATSAEDHLGRGIFSAVPYNNGHLPPRH